MSEHRNPPMGADRIRDGKPGAEPFAEVRAAIAKDPVAFELMKDALEGLGLAAAVLDEWEAVDRPHRTLIRRSCPKLGAALDALVAGPR